MELTYPDSLELDGETTVFLDRVASALDQTCVRSLLLFGTAVTGERATVSDIDLLVVLTDDAPPGYGREARRVCSGIARRVGVDGADGWIDRFLSDRTGMFRAGFVTREHALRDGRFHAAFQTSRLAYYVAPWRTVIANVLESAVPVYGPSIEPDWETIGHPRDRPFREILASGFLAVVLAIAQLPYQLIVPGSIRYALEAYKWTLYDCAYHVCDARPGGLASALECLPDPLRLHGRFQRRRDAPRFDPVLLLGTPVAVGLVHAWTAWRLAHPAGSG